MTSTTFSLTEVPEGRMLVEASAGTGKTHALAGLAVHLLGRGEVTPDGLLVVTYTRLATAELRSRIRTLVALTLGDLTAPTPDPKVADIVGALRDWNVEEARVNLQQAIAGYDSVTVTTIHGFAQRALASFGSIAGLDPDFEVLADSSRLVVDASADAYAIASAHLADLRGDAASDSAFEDPAGLCARLPRSATAVADLAQQIDGIPDLLVRPEVSVTGPDDVDAYLGDPAVSVTTVTSALAARAASVATRRRHGAGLRSYTELLTGLRDALQGPMGDSLAERLGAQFRVALIDEFQDTDLVQWEIFDRCFGRDGSRLVLVGDPKQAIYGFRGANVHTYAAVAAGGDAARRVLGTNWRSDGTLLRGLETLWTGVDFGEGIGFEPVQATPGHEQTCIGRTDRDGGAAGTIAPVEIAIAHTDALSEPGKKHLSASIAKRVIGRYVAAHVVDLLEHGVLADSTGPRPVRPDDIAILTRTNPECVVVADALGEAGVPSVIHGGGDVRTATSAEFSQKDRPSRAAIEWRTLLDAIAEPSEMSLVRAAAVGVFGPLAEPADLVDADESQIGSFQRQLVDWSTALSSWGPPALIGRVWAESGVLARVLSGPDGDRLMTDLEHIGELFTLEAGSGPVGPDRLIAVLNVGADVQEDGAERVTARRIPTGAAAVTIMTVHKSKGLEFPIVGCIGLHKQKGAIPDRAYDPVAGRQMVDLDKSESFGIAAKRDQREENLRLLYVGLTRARHHAFTCWTHEMNSPNGALTRVLFARDADGAIDPVTFAAPKVTPPPIDDAITMMRSLAASSAGTLGMRVLGGDHLEGASPVWHGAGTDHDGVAVDDPTSPTSQDATLHAAELGRELDRRAGRWSFTSITAVGEAHQGEIELPAGSGGDEGQAHLEDTTVGAAETAAVESSIEVSALAWLPAGTAFGTLIHSVLEEVDFAGPALDEDLRTALRARQAARPVELTPTGPGDAPGSGETLCVDGLVTALRSPLGPLWDDRRLCDLTRDDRLSECTFDLRLDAPADRAVTATAIGSLLLDHLAADDPYRSWADALAQGRFSVDLAGHLTGSIDLVARVGVGDDQRFVVSDYKTNRLHPAGQTPAPDAYGPAGLVEAMVAHDYPLQALLYSVALHRYLRWRLPGYDPVRHLGGVTYLFLRGMVPAGTPGAGDDRPGVASWSIPPALIEALDARFAGRKEPV